jgi:hypothetical protein
MQNPDSLQHDPAKQWARNLQANIFSGGFAGCLLVIAALIVMVAGAIAGIVLGFKVLGGFGIVVRKSSLAPFAFLGIPVGFLAFRALTPALYRLSKARRRPKHIGML